MARSRWPFRVCGSGAFSRWLAWSFSSCHAALKSRKYACLFSILFRDLTALSLHLKSRIVAHKTRTNFLLKFVRDISTEMTLTFLRASVSVRDLSTNISTSSGI